MNSLNISSRGAPVPRDTRIDMRTLLLTACLCAAVFAGFYTIGRRERQVPAPREVAPLRLPVSTSTVVVPAALGGAPELALTSPPPPPPPAAVVSHAAPTPSTPAKAHVVLAPSVSAPAETAPVQHTAPASAPPSTPASTPSPTSGGTPPSTHSAPANEGSGTSFDSSG